ncbi:TKL family protein kinase [Tritrichomonas foetus]|uniref:TKL family protein kinase n=1 Tax=Tritrichomonas foetus TaxID=1144522 RepID=A0A1J4JJU6_9EUKA|nr:TKL family protein kinase [Tritrichomonas foetus]|eukprot:OHS99434.1 TKL family protein kinase [Tritrichomonas foetus]
MIESSLHLQIRIDQKKMTNLLSHVSPELKQYLVQLEDLEMQAVVGQGTYGQVSKAVHKPTGKLCAVKKLLYEEIRGKDLIDFCREVDVLAKCDNMFLVPFYGWTSQIPLLIVTEFIPNGSLFAALRHRKGTPNLTPTQKTIIAIGVAKGMMSLHEKGIVHRDLKSLNVLLDKKIFPKICDFGVSRFVSGNNESDVMTKDVGTPHWMAPELFLSNNYTNKVDVYAYGIMLWEMLSETAPFQGKNGVQIAMVVCQNQERPAFPEKTSKPLKKFIAACWAQDPDDRPTFEQAYDVLISKKVMFEGTEPSAIDYVLTVINDDDIMRKEKLVSFGPPLKYNKAEVIAQGPRKKSGTVVQRRGFKPISPLAASPTGDVNNVGNVKLPNYEENFNLVCQNLTAANSQEFFTNCLQVIHPTSPPQIVTLVIDRIYKLIKGNQKYFNDFIQAGWLNRLPIGSDESVSITFNILKFVSSQMPTAITKPLIRYISPFINSVYGVKTLCILQPIFMIFDRIENGWIASDHLISFSAQFMEACPLEYLQALNYLLTTYSQFKSARMDYVYPILNNAILKPDNRIINVIYSMMLEFYSPQFYVSADVILRHLSNPETCTVCLSYIMKQKTEHLTKEIMYYLLGMLPTRREAYYAILCSCDRTKSGDSLVEFGGSWMTDGRMDTKMVIDLILVLYVFAELRPIISSFPELPPFLMSACTSQDPIIISAASAIVLKSIIFPQFSERIITSGFFMEYIKAVRPLTDDMSIKTCINFVDTISRVVYVEHFDYLIDYLARFVQNINAYTLSTISALASMCQYPDTAEKVKSYNLMPFIKTASTDANCLPYCQAVLAKIA